MTCAAIIAVLALAQVQTRGNEPTPPGEIVGVRLEGVLLGAPGADAAAAPSAVLGWDRVRAIEGRFAGEATPFLKAADDAWRARTRLERGDEIAAEPLFESLFPKYRGKQGPTAALVAEGLMRCRLRRGAHIAAIDPWLALVRAASGAPAPTVLHADWATEAHLASVRDEATGLAPALPPIWLGWPGVNAYAGAPRGESIGDGKVTLLSDLYKEAARFEAGLDVTLPEVSTQDPGVLLVADVVFSRAGNPSERAAARKGLQTRVSGSPDLWTEAWCRAALGRSLLREAEPEQRRLGIVQLLHLPARFRTLHPYLAGTALAEASTALEDMGDTDGAAGLRAELARDYPGHPVLDWEPLKRRMPRTEQARPEPDRPAGVEPQLPK